METRILLAKLTIAIARDNKEKMIDVLWRQIGTRGRGKEKKIRRKEKGKESKDLTQPQENTGMLKLLTNQLVSGTTGSLFFFRSVFSSFLLFLFFLVFIMLIFLFFFFLVFCSFFIVFVFFFFSSSSLSLSPLFCRLFLLFFLFVS